MLAELLRVNFLPESRVPPYAIRVLRTLVRQRRHLVKMAVMNKNRIRHLLFLHGVTLAVSDIASPKARREMRRLWLPAVTRHAIEQCLQVISCLEKSLKELEGQLQQLAGGDETVELLRTIPGVGWLRAITVFAEIGQISRFRSAKALAGYTGLVPIVRASGEGVYLGRITKKRFFNTL